MIRDWFSNTRYYNTQIKDSIEFRSWMYYNKKWKLRKIKETAKGKVKRNG